MNIITDKDALAKLIISIASAGKKLDGLVQQAGVSALAHLKEHGDIGFVNRLYLALSKGARKSALTSWILAHGSVVANTLEDKATKPFVYTKDKTTNVEAAAQDPWYSHKPDQKPDQVFDLQKMIVALIAKASKADQLVHGELVTGLQALVAQLTDGSEEPAADEDKAE